MIKMNVKFETPEQLVEFSRMCQKVEADTLIEDTAHKLIIDGKSGYGNDDSYAESEDDFCSRWF